MNQRVTQITEEREGRGTPLINVRVKRLGNHAIANATNIIGT